MTEYKIEEVKSYKVGDEVYATQEEAKEALAKVENKAIENALYYVLKEVTYGYDFSVDFSKLKRKRERLVKLLLDWGGGAE